VKNEETSHRVKEERNIFPTAKKEEKKANWIGYILVKNCLLKKHSCRKYLREENIRKKMQ